MKKKLDRKIKYGSLDDFVDLEEIQAHKEEFVKKKDELFGEIKIPQRDISLRTVDLASDGSRSRRFISINKTAI